jgi:hypothetical protein
VFLRGGEQCFEQTVEEHETFYSEICTFSVSVALYETLKQNKAIEEGMLICASFSNFSSTIFWDWRCIARYKFTDVSVQRIDSITATHDTIRGSAHQQRTHGRIDDGMSPKIELMDGSTAVSSAILETPEDDRCWSKHIVCIHQ